MNRVLCLPGCFGPSESGNPLSESPRSYPIRCSLSVGPFTHLGREKGPHAAQFVLAMKLSPRRGAKGAIGAASPHGSFTEMGEEPKEKVGRFALHLFQP